MFEKLFDIMGALPANVSTVGVQHDKLLSLVYYLTVAIFCLVNILLVFFLFKYRHRPGHRGYNYHGNNLLEFTWTLLPTLLFAALGLYSDSLWDTMKYKKGAPTIDMEIDVLGQAYAWHARYPGADGKLGKKSEDFRTPANLFGIDPKDPAGLDDIIVSGEFNLPVNKNVGVHLSSVDVIHSFFLPHFRVKQDAVPGYWVDVWFNGFKTGDFELACAELCGQGHYNMRAVVKMQSQAEFDKWMDEKIQAKALALNPSAAPAPAPAPADSTATPADPAKEGQALNKKSADNSISMR